MTTLKEILNKMKIEVNPFEEADADGLLDIVQGIVDGVDEWRKDTKYMGLVACAITARLHLDCWFNKVPGIDEEVVVIIEKSNVN